MAMTFGTLDFAVAFARQTAFPLDAKSYFESLTAAQAAAATAEEAGSSNTVYYYGQTVAGVENSVATLYVIQPDKTLAEVGGKVDINENAFAFTNDKLDLYGFATAVGGAQLTKGADGKLSWIKPDNTTVEGLSTAVAALQTTVGDSNSGLVKDVVDLKTAIQDVYTKSEVDGIVASTYKYKGTKTTYAELPAEGNVVGDVWNIATADTEHNIKAGDNVAWTGTEWDVLAGTVDLSTYATIEALNGKVDKVEGSRLMTSAEGTKLEGIEEGAQVNVIDAMSDEFTIGKGKTLNIAAISQSKVTGLDTALANKVNAEEGKGLSTNDFTTELQTKLNGIEAGADANLIETVSVNGSAIPISNKDVALPIADATNYGLVKSSSAENKVSVASGGEMEVASLNVNKLTQTNGDILILNGGSSSTVI